MQVWGLTGGMASGKTTIASIFRRLLIPVFDADKVVRKLQEPLGRAVFKIGDVFPDVVQDGVLDRGALRKKILENQEDLKKLEEILHPLVAEEREKFLRFWRRRGARLVILDIPLLFEIGLENQCDKVLVAIAPLSLRMQRIRARRRVGGGRIMNEKEAYSLIMRQMPDKERKRKADIILYTIFSYGYLTQNIKKILSDFYRSTEKEIA